ncbi:MAG TPA: hypothetical protein VK911_05790 [Vicinamibacterales bacterium]|nr:hypothetical protein [Vicinamibacterales bacterium]
MDAGRLRKRVWGLGLGLVLSCGVALAQQPPAPPRPAPTPEMERLSKLIVGDYAVRETHHARPGRPEWSIEGTASYRPGPDGLSVVEEYRSNNPHGPFSAIAVMWWDVERGAFRHFECETGQACDIPDELGSWEGEAVVFRRTLERQGRKIALETRFDFGQPSAPLVYSVRYSLDGAAPVTNLTIRHEKIANPVRGSGR